MSGVLLETQPPEGRALAGEPLVLICSAAEGTGDTTFSWHREDTGESLGRKRRRSQRAQLEIPAVGGSHAGGYFCTADNGHGLACSAVLNVTVTGEPSSPAALLSVASSGWGWAWPTPLVILPPLVPLCHLPPRYGFFVGTLIGHVGPGRQEPFLAPETTARARPLTRRVLMSKSRVSSLTASQGRPCQGHASLREASGPIAASCGPTGPAILQA